MKRSSLAALTLAVSATYATLVFAGCGSESVVVLDDAAPDGTSKPPGEAGGDGSVSPDGSNPDGGTDGSTDGSRPDATDSGPPRDGGPVVDGSRPDAPVCTPQGGACTSSADCCTANCDTTKGTCEPPATACKAPGDACATGVECCTLSCTAGRCDARLCVGDGLSCATDSDCCSSLCDPDPVNGGGKCTPLNPACKTAGNACAADGDCCSLYCNGGLCGARPSYCAQPGDTCATDTDCCTGLCTKSGGATLGICGTTPSVPGSPNCTVAGVLCFEASTTCGGSCCSRKCAPFGPTGRSICQPASGCRPTGEICVIDADCCGSATLPDGRQSEVTCARKNPSDAVGKCDNGKRCSPAGSICKLATTSCNATDRCCAGTVQTNPLLCQQDALGVPRCMIAATNCTTPPPAGTTCASSSDCCGNPCIPAPGGGFVCGAPDSCVPVAGVCTTHADCCPGTPCVFPPGSSSGTCGGVIAPDGGIVVPDGGSGSDSGSGSDAGSPDSGVPNCALYGQQCTVTADCCDGVPCTSGRCRTP